MLEVAWLPTGDVFCVSDRDLLHSWRRYHPFFPFLMTVAVAVAVDVDVVVAISVAVLLLYFCCFVVVSSFCSRFHQAALHHAVSLATTMIVVSLEPWRVSCGTRLEVCR